MNENIEQLSTRSVDIVRISESTSENIQDGLAVEEPLEISLSIPDAEPPLISKNISITMRTPGGDEDLALGFLFTEGIIKSYSQVSKVVNDKNRIHFILNHSQDLDLSKLDRHFYTSSSCGVCGKASLEAIKTVCQLDSLPQQQWRVQHSLLYSLPEKLRTQQAVFESTGGIHAAALFSQSGDFLLSREDVGRHNALDKLIGAALNDHSTLSLPLNEQLLLLSGRASFELIQKAVMAGIKFIMAIGAPSSLAVELAKEHEITLVGFLKRDRYNIYSRKDRIKLQS